MEQNSSDYKAWLEHYAIEDGPQPHEMSRVAQMALSVNAPRDVTFAICKYVAPIPQSSVEGIRWDRVSLDSQTLIMTLKHLSLIEEHYWRIEGVLKIVSNTHILRPRHDGDSGMILFEKGMPVVAYYNTRSGAGWVGPDLPDETVFERQYAAYDIVLQKCLDDPARGVFFMAQASLRPEIPD